MLKFIAGAAVAAVIAVSATFAIGSPSNEEPDTPEAGLFGSDLRIRLENCVTARDAADGAEYPKRCTIDVEAFAELIDEAVGEYPAALNQFAQLSDLTPYDDRFNGLELDLRGTKLSLRTWRSQLAALTERVEELEAVEHHTHSALDTGHEHPVTLAGSQLPTRVAVQTMWNAMNAADARHDAHNHDTKYAPLYYEQDGKEPATLLQLHNHHVHHVHSLSGHNHDDLVARIDANEHDILLADQHSHDVEHHHDHRVSVGEQVQITATHRGTTRAAVTMVNGTYTLAIDAGVDYERCTDAHANLYIDRTGNGHFEHIRENDDGNRVITGIPDHVHDNHGLHVNHGHFYVQSHAGLCPESATVTIARTE